MDFYPVSIIRHKGDVSVESMVEILKTVLKGLLEITWPEKLTTSAITENSRTDLFMCMSILSEHWAPRCKGTCCLSILANAKTTLK